VNLALDRHAAARLAMTSHELNKNAVIAKKVVIARRQQPTQQSSDLALDRHAASRLAMTFHELNKNAIAKKVVIAKEAVADEAIP
jgi:hypothetical protein